MKTVFSMLSNRIKGPIYFPKLNGFPPEVPHFNTAVVHNPEMLVRVQSVDDISETVKFANQHQLSVSVQATGHGSFTSIHSDILISTQDLDQVSINPRSGIATIAAGVRWQKVIDAASPYNLTPVCGSSPSVGAIGYMLGGGFGPLARSHGVSSDYVTGFKMVTSKGELIEVDESQNQDLFWTLKGGGKLGFGIITEMQMRLVNLEKIYGGSLFFEEQHIEKALRAWTDWTKTADPNATTSVILIKFPPIDLFPPHLRGRRLLAIRFAYPENMERGALLAEPLRQFAPVYIDDLRVLAASQADKIHNDPTTPGPVYLGGRCLSSIDQQLVGTLLKEFGMGSTSPFAALEIRHLGSALKAGEKSAVGGRGAEYAVGFLGKRPDLFAEVLPREEDRLLELMKPWLSEERIINFLGKPRSDDDFMQAWSPSTGRKLTGVRDKYDPNNMFTVFRASRESLISDGTLQADGPSAAKKGKL